MVTTKELIDCLQGTMMPDVRQHYEEQLQNMNKIVGFTPGLLQIVMMNDLDMPVRQAGVIYLKNMVTQHWRDVEVEEPGAEIPFHIHENDREVIRDLIVDAVVHAPHLVRVQLSVCIHLIIKHDFPGKWPGVVHKIQMYLEKSEVESWLGALLCLYQLIKFYEYKKKESRGPINEAMTVFLPMIYQRVTHLLSDQSQQSVTIQKTALKILFAYIQFTMSTEIITKEIFTQWMEVMRHIINAPIPREAEEVDEDCKPQLIWWKAKKWCLHLLVRISERYGTVGAVSKEYSSFAKWYVKSFTPGVMEMIMKILNDYHNKVYTSPRVLQLSLSYVEKNIGQVATWKCLRPHAMSIIEKVVFPLLCHSDEDEQLWQCDPAEYVKAKTDIYNDLVSPVSAAQGVLQCFVRKRKEMLEKTMGFIVQALMSNVPPRQKFGIFHMIGTLGSTLQKKPAYKDQMERMLVEYVFPEFTSPYAFIRARTLWLLTYLEGIQFTQEENLVKVVTFMQDSLLVDSELPVKVEAALCIAVYLSSHSKTEKLLQPRMREIVQQLLLVIKQTENEEVTNVMCKLVNTYGEQLSPIAKDICTELAAMFQQVIEAEDGAEERAITAMGLLGTIEAILNCMDENVEIMTSLEPIVLQVIAHILNSNIIDFYEEAFSLIYSLTSSRISSDLWRCYEMLYNIFSDDGFDYFTEMMPAFHNYITIDTTGFLDGTGRVEAMIKICKTILQGDTAEDEEAHAAKLLEVVILQCGSRLGNDFIESIMGIVVERLIKQVKTTELRTMLLQVVIAALYTAPLLVLPTLQGTALPNTNVPILTHFVKQWVHDADCFFGLHDRKLCVLGFCTLLQLGPEKLPILTDLSKDILPSIVLLFKGLKSAYAAKALSEASDEDSSDDEDDSDSDVLDDDDDEISESAENFLEQLSEKEDSDEDESDDDLDEDLDETTLESYTTPLDKDECEIDEYWIFKTVMQSIESAMPDWYRALTQNLNEEQKTILIEISTLADQRLAARESKKIEESGGYNFSQTAVPSSFNFGGAFGS